MSEIKKNPTEELSNNGIELSDDELYSAAGGIIIASTKTPDHNRTNNSFSCPNCHSGNTEKLIDNKYCCQDCQTVFKASFTNNLM